MMRIMHGNVKVGDSGVPFGVQKNVVGFDITVHNSLAVKIHETRGQLSSPKANYVLRKIALAVKMISKVATEHEVQDEEAIIVILESIAKVDQEGVVDLLKQSSFLDDVGNSLLFDALLLVHVLERIKFLALFMFNDANLAKGTFTDHSVEVEVIKRDFAGEIDVLGGCTTHDSIIGRGRG